MKNILPCLVAGALLASCMLFDDERPNVSMVADVNNLTLSTDDTLVITRAVTNTGTSDLWLNATPDAFELTSAGGGAGCVDGSLALRTLELVRVPADSGIVIERRYPLAGRLNCGAGNYFIALVAHLRTREGANDSYTLRTSSSPFVLTVP